MLNGKILQTFAYTLLRYAWGLFSLMLLWYLGYFVFGEHILPNPLKSISVFWQSLHQFSFWEHAGISFWRVCAALFFAWIIAFPLGIILGSRKNFDLIISPFIFLTYPVPKVVFLPVLLSIFGLGDIPRILLISLVVGYQILLITRASVIGLDKKYIDSFRSLHGTQAQMIWHVLLPAALPDAITSLKVASGTAFAILFIAESFATQHGLGFLIMDTWGRGDVLGMFSAIIAMSVLGVILYEFCSFLERRYCCWKI